MLERVPQALLVIAGEGPAREALRAQVAALGLQSSVQFAGYLERDTALLDCYAAADVFVFASRTETQGLVLLEAMAQGAPVVSTAELGTRSILRARVRRARGAGRGGGLRRSRGTGAHGCGAARRARRARARLCPHLVIRCHGPAPGAIYEQLCAAPRALRAPA